MRPILYFSFILLYSFISAQDYYDQARQHYNENNLDSARYYINKNLTRKPSAEDYFLSAMIHEAENKDLRALADYEAVIQKDPYNLEAYFQKGLIYYNSASNEQAIKDFTYVIDNQSRSETKAVYYGIDPSGSRGTFLTTLQSMISKVYQYRAMAYEKNGEWDKAIDDFTAAFEYDTTVDGYINRSQLYAKMGRKEAAITDLKKAIQINPDSYRAWYNLAILDESTQPPEALMANDEFTPMLNLAGANAYESGNYSLSAQYHTRAIKADPNDDLAYISRGKALLRTGAYGQARQDFIKAMQLEPSRTEAFYLIGNSFFYEQKFQEAVGFYERYLSIDRGYKNVWFNAAMAYLSLDEDEKGCEYLRQAEQLGMDQAMKMLEKHCGSQ